MKILLASTGSDISSGAVRCLLELAMNLIKREIDVLITIPKHGNIEDELKKQQIPYQYVHEYHSWYTSEKHKGNQFFLKRLLNYKAFLQMRELIKKEKIDIVHENALTAYVAAWAAESLNIPLVWHIREFMEEDLNIAFYNKDYSKKIINKAAYMIAISNAIADKWKSEFSIPIRVIYDGLSASDYYIEKKQYLTNQDVIKVIIYGRIVEPKGQFFFFQGMNRVMNLCNRKIKCYWAGQIEDQDYFDRINQFISDNNMIEQVEYLGQVKDMKIVLSDMDVVAVCSKKEGFGRVTVESMFSGCIVIGADTGATKEIIDDEVNGFLYKQGDLDCFVSRMKYVLENIDENRKIAQKAQNDAMRKFSIENSIQSIIELYESIVP